MAQELVDVQSINGLHQNVESQSTRRPNGASPDHARAPTRLARPEVLEPIIHSSRAMDEVLTRIKRMRDISGPILITGETGTGKELVARLVHGISPRHKQEFIPFNCGGLTPELIAGELFGYRRGAFTGADRDYKGVIRTANGGTLLMDEIGELPLEAQTGLLRFLEEGEVRLLGEARPIKVDVRVVASTNRDLESEVRAGRFRDDLFWRLNVFRVHIPPLRERREDIRPLIKHFLARRQLETGKEGLELSDQAWELMFDYQWPGNVRQLAAVAYRLVAFAENNELIGRERALDAIGTGICAPPPVAVVIEGQDLRDLPFHEAMDEVQRFLVEDACPFGDAA
ncbi:MAG: sigma 54-interacting transcriptional regulator [Blastocatellia bacterium]